MNMKVMGSIRSIGSPRLIVRQQVKGSHCATEVVDFEVTE